MSVLDKPAPSILLIDNDLQDIQVMTTWLNELGQEAQIAKENNLDYLLQEKDWKLIILDVALDDVKKKAILKMVMDFPASIFICLLTSNDANEFFANINMPSNLVLVSKPLDKNGFLDAIFNHSESIFNRRTRKDRRHHEQRITLFIGAHPDDVEIGCGGCIARHYQQGDSINILTLSSGESGGDFAIRREEAKRSAEILHANLFIKELTDTQVSHVDTIHLIEEVVHQLMPTHVYTHSIHDAHQDHRNVHHASVVSCRSIPNLYCYQSPSTTIHFKPNLFVEISNYIETKLAALAVYQSQISKRPYLQESIIRATARYWGRYSNYNLAEPMEIIRQTESLRGQKRPPCT